MKTEKQTGGKGPGGLELTQVILRENPWGNF